MFTVLVSYTAVQLELRRFELYMPAIDFPIKELDPKRRSSYCIALTGLVVSYFQLIHYRYQMNAFLILFFNNQANS